MTSPWLTTRLPPLLAFLVFIAYTGGSGAMLKTLKFTAYAAFGLAGSAALGLYWYQTKLIYPANMPEGSRDKVENPRELLGIPYQDLTLTTPDAVKIRAYLIPALQPSKAQSLVSAHRNKKLEKERKEKAGQAHVEEEDNERGADGWVGPKRSDSDDEWAKKRPTVIMYHANAGNMGHRVPIAHVFWQLMGCNVLMLSYRGYGLSEGTPSERGMRIDAQTALDYTCEHALLKGTKKVVYGQSIGGAVCIDVASRNPGKISAVILENTLLSLRTLIPLLIPALKHVLRIPGMLTEHWDAQLTLHKIPSTTPMLLLASQKDEVVHPSQMREIKALREKAGGKVEWVEFATATHNDTPMQPKYFETIHSFLKKELSI